MQSNNFFHSIFSPAVREELILEGPDGGFSGDLTAINVQRGRDHGLPPYVEFLRACGKRIRTFGQLRQVMSFLSRLRLRRVYRSVLDIDLFAGAMNEFPLRGSAVGFTFGCILTQQFRNLRRGDRFWYERNDQKVGFTLRQLTQIRKVTMARVLCDNLDGYRWSQPWTFVVPSRRNRFRACSRIRAMNFTPFKECKALFSLLLVEKALRQPKTDSNNSEFQLDVGQRAQQSSFQDCRKTKTK